MSNVTMKMVFPKFCVYRYILGDIVLWIKAGPLGKMNVVQSHKSRFHTNEWNGPYKKVQMEVFRFAILPRSEGGPKLSV